MKTGATLLLPIPQSQGGHRLCRRTMEEHALALSYKSLTIRDIPSTALDAIFALFLSWRHPGQYTQDVVLYFDAGFGTGDVDTMDEKKHE